jgi:hypothetical protein
LARISTQRKSWAKPKHTRSKQLFELLFNLIKTNLYSEFQNWSPFRWTDLHPQLPHTATV